MGVCGSRLVKAHREDRNRYFAQTMSDDEGQTFETGDAGSAHTYPQAAGELRKGSYVMIKGHPCKVAEVTTSKTGKHGHAKVHIVALDIFTSKKYEDLCPTSHNVEVPFVKRIEYQVMNIDGQSVSLMEEGAAETKDDLNLPNVVSIGEPTDDDNKLTKDIEEAFEKGDKNVIVIVQSACDTEKIIGMKLV